MKVYLKYCFIFDPSELWSHVSQFDDDLASYFRSLGFEAEVVKSGNNDSQEQMVYLNKVETLVVPEPPKQPSQVLKQMSQKRGYDGRYKKPSGA